MRNDRSWQDPPSPTPDESLAATIGGHPLVAQILAQRGFTTPSAARAFLSPDNYTPASPSELPDLAGASEHLDNAIKAGHPILIWGDFDVDGQTATALLVDALHSAGGNVSFYIPNRLRESHGIRVESLRDQMAAMRPTLLLTCDTGVSAHTAIEYARSQGMVVLITDHHDLPPKLPDAEAVVNPKRLPGSHPLASLPGVGVAYKLIEHLYTQHGRADALSNFLDLVALGIVADVAEQTRDTRYLLQIGLERLRNTERIGLQAIIESAQIDREHLGALDIGFQIGPRLNAAGRLADAGPVVEMLTTSDRARALLLAQQLEGLNNQRRLQTGQIYTAAQEQIARDPSLLEWEALVLGHPAWHAGIVGIVANRLAEQYARPVILLNTADPERARGSARSVPGYDIGAAIAAQADLLLEYGGHPGAAGLSLHPDRIPAFRRRLSDTLRETRDPLARPGLPIDAYVPLDAVTLELTNELNRLAPFGEGNPPVTLATCELTLHSATHIGRTQEHRRLIVQNAQGTRQNVLWWNGADQPLPDGLFDLAYQVDISRYRGEAELQLTLVDFRRSASAPVEVTRPARQVLDYRDTPDPVQSAREIQERYPGAVFWAEGYRRSESPGLPLSDLSPAEVLVVYTAPDGPQPLQEALERVQPSLVVLVGIDPPICALADVFKRLLELMKYVINRQAGHTTLTALSEAVAQSLRTTQAALDYVAERGEICVETGRAGAVTLTLGEGIPGTNIDQKLAAFEAGVAETAAYRAYFRRASAASLAGEQS